MDYLYLLVKLCHCMRGHLLSIILQQIFFFKRIFIFSLNDVILHLHISYILQPQFQYYYENLYHTFFANNLILMYSFIYSGTTFVKNSNVYFDIKIPTSKKLDFWSNFLGSVQNALVSFNHLFLLLRFYQ